jgi:hypothetical protein
LLSLFGRRVSFLLSLWFVSESFLSYLAVIYLPSLLLSFFLYFFLLLFFFFLSFFLSFIHLFYFIFIFIFFIPFLIAHSLVTSESGKSGSGWCDGACLYVSHETPLQVERCHVLWAHSHVPLEGM